MGPNNQHQSQYASESAVLRREISRRYLSRAKPSRLLAQANAANRPLEESWWKVTTHKAGLVSSVGSFSCGLLEGKTTQRIK